MPDQSSFYKTSVIISEPDHIAFCSPGTRLWRSLQLLVNIFFHWLGKEESCATRFLLVPVFSGAGAVTYFSLKTEPLWEQIFLFGGMIAGLLYLFRRIRSLFLLFGFLLISIFGFLCAKTESARLATIMISNEVSTFVTGRIVDLEEVEVGNHLILDVVATERPVLQYMPARIRLFARHLPEGVVVGSAVKGFVRIRPPSGPVRSGNYDFSFHQYFRGIGAQGFFMGLPDLADVRSSDNIPEQIKGKIAQLRSLITQRITKAIPGEAGAVSAALVTGQRGKISRKTNDALRSSGLAHILSISGLHMAMVTGLVLAITRAFLGLFPIFSSCYSSRKIAAAIALVTSGFYLLLSGVAVSALRSFVMVAVMLLAVLFGRTAITMRNLAIAALVIIFVVPHELVGPGFQMSFAATAALVTTFEWWNTRQYRKKNNRKDKYRSLFFSFMVVPVVSTAASSLVAGVVSGVYAAFHFNNTALFGILSNVLAFPVMFICVMPFALLAVVVMPLSLDWIPLQIMGAGVAIVQKIAFWVAAVSPDLNPGIITPASLVFLTIGMVLFLFLRSSLRYTSLLFLACGLFLYAETSLPLALIFENGKLAAIVRDDKKLAINVNRPPALVINNWRSVFGAGETVYPQDMMNREFPENRFYCELYYCQARLANGQILTVAEVAGYREKACKTGDIIFLNFSGNPHPCSGKITITRKQLALYGTVEIHESANETDLVWASGIPVRPWNRHRKFSRTARGMP